MRLDQSSSLLYSGPAADRRPISRFAQIERLHAATADGPAVVKYSFAATTQAFVYMFLKAHALKRPAQAASGQSPRVRERLSRTVSRRPRRCSRPPAGPASAPGSSRTSSSSSCPSVRALASGAVAPGSAAVQASATCAGVAPASREMWWSTERMPGPLPLRY